MDNYAIYIYTAVNEIKVAVLEMAEKNGQQLYKMWSLEDYSYDKIDSVFQFYDHLDIYKKSKVYYEFCFEDAKIDTTAGYQTKTYTITAFGKTQNYIFAYAEIPYE